MAETQVLFDGVAAPLIYVSAGQASAANQDYTLNSADNPAAKGSIITF